MLRNQREQTLRYIRDRRCDSGGYCFYRLDEPNAADTFYALASYRLLDEPVPDDEATVRLLHRFQHTDGSYGNIFVGHAAIRGLLLLRERPEHDPVDWITRALTPVRPGGRPVESVSEFGQILLAIESSTLLGIPVPAERKDEIIKTIIHYRHEDWRFGSPASTLIETSHAAAILSSLGCDTTPYKISAFVRMCEDPAFGFLALPGVRPGFLEHIHAGLKACMVLSCKPKYPGASKEFIHRCYRENGGYCRSLYGGSATLEYTYLALDSLAMIHALSNNAVMCPR